MFAALLPVLLIVGWVIYGILRIFCDSQRAFAILVWIIGLPIFFIFLTLCGFLFTFIGSMFGGTPIQSLLKIGITWEGMYAGMGLAYGIGLVILYCWIDIAIKCNSLRDPSTIGPTTKLSKEDMKSYKTAMDIYNRR